MSDEEDPLSADVPPTSEVSATETTPQGPEVPSIAPVDGWVRGVDGKWWPPAPPRQRPGPRFASSTARPKRGRRIVGGIGFAVFAVVVLAIVAGIVLVLANYGDDSSSAGATKGAHPIGTTVRTASVDATVTGAQDPYTEPNPAVPQPGPGYHFVAVQLTMTNVSTKDVVVAPEQLFQLTDADGQKQQLISTTSLPTLEGALIALGTRQGGVVFTVLNTARAPLTFRVKGEPGAGGVTFAIP